MSIRKNDRTKGPTKRRVLENIDPIINVDSKTKIELVGENQDPKAITCINVAC